MDGRRIRSRRRFSLQWRPTWGSQIRCTTKSWCKRTLDMRQLVGHFPWSCQRRVNSGWGHATKSDRVPVPRLRSTLCRTFRATLQRMSLSVMLAERAVRLLIRSMRIRHH